MKILLLIVIIITAIESLQGQKALNDSLPYYLELAARNNPVVLQRFSEYEAALQKVPQVGALQDPDLIIGVFISPMELIEGKQIADIKLMQMFPWFGTLKAAKDEMSLMAKAKYESFRDAKLQVFYDVQRTYYELYKTNKEIEISEENIRILKTIERLALVKFRSSAISESGIPSSSGGSVQSPQQSSPGSSGMSGGMAGSQTAAPSSGMSSSASGNSMGTSSTGSGLADLYRILLETGELENNTALLYNQKNTISAKFNSYLNRPVKSAVFVIDTLIQDTINFSLESVSDSMFTNNPMLGMLDYEQQSLDARKIMVTRMGYPMLGIGVDYSLIKPSEMSTSSMNGKVMIMPMAQITIPIYRKKYRAMRNEVNLSKTATQYNYTATANLLQTEYYEAIQLYQDAQRRIKLYSDQYTLARKTLDIMTKSFSASGSNLTDILRVQQQTLDIELKKIEAVTDYNISIAWLKRLMALVQTE